MRSNRVANLKPKAGFVLTLAGLTLALTLLPDACAQTPAADVKPAEAKATESRTFDSKYSPGSYQTIYLQNATQQNDLNDIQTALRNMLSRARIYGTPSQNSISVWASSEDQQLAQKIVAELDRHRPTYRLTYTITVMDGGKRVNAQHFALIVVSGGKSEFKQGNRVPVVTASTSEGGTPQNSVTYIDVGLNIEANVDGSPDGVRVHSKVTQSSVAEEKSVVTQDPTIRQSSLDGSSILTPGKPLVLGALDVPGSTRHEDLEVVAELVK